MAAIGPKQEWDSGVSGQSGGKEPSSGITSSITKKVKEFLQTKGIISNPNPDTNYAEYKESSSSKNISASKGPIPPGREKVSDPTVEERVDIVDLAEQKYYAIDPPTDEEVKTSGLEEDGVDLTDLRNAPENPRVNLEEFYEPFGNVTQTKPLSLRHEIIEPPYKGVGEEYDVQAKNYTEFDPEKDVGQPTSNFDVLRHFDSMKQTNVKPDPKKEETDKPHE